MNVNTSHWKLVEFQKVLVNNRHSLGSANVYTSQLGAFAGDAFSYCTFQQELIFFL